MEKIRDLLIQCHETQAEMEGLCEESLFLGIDIRKVYASAAATGDDSGFWSGFNQQLKDQYQDYLDELIVKNEEVLRDIGKGVLGHFQDAMVDQIKSYYQNIEPRKAAVKIKNLKRKLKNVYFIFSRRSPEIRHFSHDIKLKIIGFYNSACRSMADGDNAFVFNDRETRKKVVVMCPGAYLRQGLSDVQNFNATEIAPRILSVFTHEFAHILNSRKNKRSFIVDNFPYRLRSCHQTWYDLPEDVRKSYNRYYKEIEADVLGNLALGKMLRSESFSSVSKEIKLDIIKRSYGIFFVINLVENHILPEILELKN